jgi:hypothetical protein
MERMTHSRLRLVVLGLVAVLAVALAVPALAQSDDDDAPTGQSAPKTDDADGPGRFAEALADELGDDVTAEEVADAIAVVAERFAAEREERLRSALRERLDTAVEDGALTRAQADAILEAAEEGVFGGRALERLGRGFPGLGDHRGLDGAGGPRWWHGGDGDGAAEPGWWDDRRPDADGAGSTDA